MIKYLLKFVKEEDHAKDLLAGQLFMRPARYYRTLEQGQGDLSEAAISHISCIYRNGTLPIYCMYAVCENDIRNNCISISEKCIHDFKCKHGYVVITEFSEFENKLKTLNSNGYEVDFGLVNYRYLSISDTKKLLTDTTVNNLFIKHPAFSYQKEFRVVVAKQVYKLGDPKSECPAMQHITYQFSCGLAPDKAQAIPVSSLEKVNDNYIIHLEEIK